MERTLGEKSYNPKPFEIDFWGTCAGDDQEYKEFRQRKVRGNILLAAYYSPMTIQELSIELGIAVPYLEDEIRLLIKRQYLVEKNHKVVTNIPIFTMECNEAIEKNLQILTNELINSIIPVLESEYQDYQRDSGVTFANENLLRWQVVTLCSHFSLLGTGPYIDQKYGEMPDKGPYSLINGGGGKGFVWGRSIGNEKRKFNGIYDGYPYEQYNGSIVVFNFSQIENAQTFETRMVQCVIGAALEGSDKFVEVQLMHKLTELGYFVSCKPNFPVYTKEKLSHMANILNESIKTITMHNRSICELAGKLVADHAPTHIRQTAEHLGSYIYQHDSLYYLVDALMKKGWLLAVDDMEKPAMFVIRNT